MCRRVWRSKNYISLKRISRAYYQMRDVFMWKQARCSVSPSSPHLHRVFFSLNSSLTIQVAPAWPPPPPHLWLPYLLLHVVGKFSRLSVGHCFQAECLTGRRKEAKMGRGGRNEALEAKKKKKKQRQQTRRGRGGVRSPGFQLCQFAGENQRKALRKHPAGSQTLSITPRELYLAAADGCRGRKLCRRACSTCFSVLCIWHVGAHPPVGWDKPEHRACKNFTLEENVIGYISIKSDMNVRLSRCMREWGHPHLCYRWREFPSLHRRQHI